MKDAHHSTFELDVWFASGERDAAITEHVADCDRCSAYVKTLEALDAPLPARPRRPSPFVVGGVALALAAALLLFLRGRPDDYVGEKGAPAVQVIVRGENGTRVWDGRSPVHAGDALALHVACEGLAQVAVTSSGARLSDAACPTSPGPLPFTLVVDDQPGSERFAVVLSRAALSDADLRDAAAKETRTRDVWTMRFEIAKEPR